ncbi:acyltransferase [Hymenobacter sp. 15J16-1T3B]|uniref:acyltransferase family protein n=1 Tax=Hymenobacter sp. 15J16-1T3B TaxID=2886941 RepID=UPI001D12E3C8|nr:acyltransferase [Hymenobacter sp. 15J16-1T3B]MCC3157503.1 acyltransferase [Hymenobacter sp. 15J16-1T3B]
MSPVVSPPSTTGSARQVVSNYLPALTGVRAIAAFLVYLHHSNTLEAGQGITGFLHDVLLELHVGVPFFFVLSGFLITLRYYGTQRWNARWWKNYMRNRMARIYPMFFLLTTLTFAVEFLHKGLGVLSTWLVNITFLRGFFDDYKYTGVMQGWTLPVEECFYLFAPIAFAILHRRPRLLWVLPLGLIGFGCLLVAVLAPLHFHGLFGNFKFMILYTFFGRAIEFFTGIQLAIWYRRGLLRPKRGLLTLAGTVALLALIVLMILVRGPHTYGLVSPMSIFVNNVILPLGVALWYAGLLTENTWLRTLLSTRLFQLLGKSSYVFYLIHMGLLQYLINRYITTSIPVQFVLLNLLAIGLYYSIEQPLNKIFRAPSNK